MGVERYLRLIAGLFVLICLALARVHSEYWLIFTAFAGLNLLQSGFTDWCPMKSLLKYILGRKHCSAHRHGESCQGALSLK